MVKERELVNVPDLVPVLRLRDRDNSSERDSVNKRVLLADNSSVPSERVSLNEMREREREGVLESVCVRDKDFSEVSEIVDENFDIEMDMEVVRDGSSDSVSDNVATGVFDLVGFLVRDAVTARLNVWVILIDLGLMESVRLRSSDRL